MEIQEAREEQQRNSYLLMNEEPRVHKMLVLTILNIMPNYSSFTYTAGVDTQRACVNRRALLGELTLQCPDVAGSSRAPPTLG